MSTTEGDSAEYGTSDSRSHKRVKISNQSSSPRIRGFTACENCRLRKIKCNNARPTCGHCAHLGRECVFPDDIAISPCREIGERVLEAVNKLSDLIKSQDRHPVSHVWNNVPDNHIYLDSQSLISPQGVASRTIATPDDAVGKGTDAWFLRYAPVSAQGTDAVLSWSIFARPEALHLSLEHDDDIAVLTHAVPSFSKQEMLRLTDRYVRGVHTMNPVLELTEVYDKISYISESGPDWTTRTCLIALICAIGAANQLSDSDHTSPSALSTHSALQFHVEYEANMALSKQYWGVAVKRLGIAVVQSDTEAVQCLSLAGIFCMHFLKPVQAWKYFNLAGAAWHALNLVGNHVDVNINQSPNAVKSITVMQSLYFTIWKSEGELALEIDVPGPILDNIRFSQMFPTPPEAESGMTPWDTEHQRTWLYYLAEIAVRHLINRILRTYYEFDFTHPPSSEKVRSMLAYEHTLKAQLKDWHSSLPVILQFDIPEDSTTLAYVDDLTQILRARFLTCSDLLSRPFVRLCIESSLQLDQNTRSQVIQRASENVLICILRLSQVAPHFHQGTWFGLRNFATASSILYAINLARQHSWLSAAQEIFLPDNWQERIRSAGEILHQFSVLKDSHVTGIFKIVQTLQKESEQ